MAIADEANRNWLRDQHFFTVFLANNRRTASALIRLRSGELARQAAEIHRCIALGVGIKQDE